MADNSLVVANWPITPGCMAWSHDGCIAIGVRECVDVFLPIVTREQAADEAESASRNQWEKLRLQTSYWTMQEFPNRPLGNRKIFSFGEEQSPSNPVAVGWSPPGLARHARCALAILSSNLRLSIWAPGDDPRNVTDWCRTLIINSIIDKYFEKNQDPKTDQSDPEVVSITTRRRRIRAFTWCSPTRDSLEHHSSAHSFLWSEHILAISNDFNEIVFVRVRRRVSLVPAKEWSAAVLSHFAFTQDLKGSKATEGIDDVDSHLQLQSHTLGLAWSPWYYCNNVMQSVLAYTTGQGVRFRLLNLSGVGTTRTNFKAALEDAFELPMDIKPGYPLRWHQQPTENGSLTLVVFSIDTVMCLEFPTNDSADVRKSECDLDGRHDVVTGIVFAETQAPRPDVHFSTLTSTNRPSSRARLKLPLDKQTSLASPAWQNQINEARELYSTQRDIFGPAVSRIWGLVESCLGDLVASAYALHPTTIVEYRITAEQSYNVLVSQIDAHDGRFYIGPRRHGCWKKDISMEAVTFSVRRWYDRHAKTDEEAEESRRMILDTLHETFLGRDPVDISIGDGVRSSGMIAAFKQVIFANHETTKQRLSTIVDIACNDSKEILTSRKLLVELFLTILHSNRGRLGTESIFSRKTLRAHALALSGLRGGTQDAASQVHEDEQEKCEICGSQIRFTSLSIAYCEEGHHSVRCGLSFLAIQSPGITKHCGICGVPYFTDAYIDAHDSFDDVSVAPAVEEQHEINGASEGNARVPLTRALFAACDVCIYCGGKFLS